MAGGGCAAARYRLARRVQDLSGPSDLPSRIAGGIKQGWLAALSPAEKHTMSLIGNIPRAIVEAHADAVTDYLSHLGKPEARTIAAPGLQGILNAIKGFGTGLSDARNDFSGFWSKRALTPGGTSAGQYAEGGIRYKTALARWLDSRVRAWSGARNRPFYQAAYEYNLTARARAAAIRRVVAAGSGKVGDLTRYYVEHPTADMVIDAHAAAERFTFGQENAFSRTVANVKGGLRGAAKEPPKPRSAREAAEAQAALEGKTGAARADRVAQLMSLPSNDFNAQVTIPRARTAEELTGARRAGSLSRGAAAVVDVASGFPRIAQNLATASADYTPLGLAKTLFQTATAAPGSRAATLITGLAKNGSLAGGVMALGYHLASEGQMTGPHPLNPSAGGNPSYHVRIGDRWYDYTLLEPLAAGLASGAALYEDTKLHPENYLSHIEAASLEGAHQAGRAVSTTVGPIADFLGGRLNDAGRAAGSLATAPVPTVVRQIARGASGDRDTSAPTFAGKVENQVKASIPGVANTLPKKENAFGQQMRPGGASEALRDVLIAGGATPDRTRDPVVAEFDRLHVPLTPAKSERTFAHGHVKVELTPEEHNLMLESQGRAFHDMIAGIIARPDYQAATPEQQRALLKRMKVKLEDLLDRPAFIRKIEVGGGPEAFTTAGTP